MTALLATPFVDMTPFESVIAFAGIPLMVIAIVVLLVAGPEWTRAGRSRPGVTWDGTTWLGERPKSDSADEASDPGGSSARW